MASRTYRPDASVSDHPWIPLDSVDCLLADWHRVRPDLDFSSVAVVSRLERVWGHIEVELEGVYAEHSLSAPNFSVLVTLARLNAPGGVPQRRLMDELGLTSGTVSVRVDRLVEQRLVDRHTDPDDKRNARITLTDLGKSVFEQVAPTHLANERRLLMSLSQAEQEALATLLRKLLVGYEGSLPSAESAFRLGMRLASAHVTLRMRSMVGLPPVAGLLVHHLEAKSTAAHAGIRQGDVLVRAGGRELRSAASLYAAIAAAASSGVLRAEIVRGVVAQTGGNSAASTRCTGWHPSRPDRRASGPA